MIDKRFDGHRVSDQEQDQLTDSAVSIDEFILILIGTALASIAIGLYLDHIIEAARALGILL